MPTSEPGGVHAHETDGVHMLWWKQIKFRFKILNIAPCTTLEADSAHVQHKKHMEFVCNIKN